MGKIPRVVSDGGNNYDYNCPHCGGSISVVDLQKRTRGLSNPNNVLRIKRRVRELQQELDHAEEVSGEHEIQQA